MAEECRKRRIPSISGFPASEPELKTPDGTLVWGEGQPGLPSLLPQAELLALQLEDYCPKK